MNRLTSLDFFRGATVACMIMVNDPGNWSIKYDQLSHAEWEGCTFTDLIFPFFLFIVGVSVSFAYGKALAKGRERKELLWKAAKRTAIIFGIGLFLNLFPYFNFSELRIPGVLQRIALVFFFCSIAFLYLRKSSQYFLFGEILIGYYVLLMYVPVPGIGPANLEPINNFTAWFDRLILEGYIGKSGQGQYDSTGIFTTIPAIASGLVGVFVGHLLSSKKLTENEQLIWLFVAGAFSMLAGWAFSFEFPMIKRLWTSTYVLYSSGIALLSFATIYWFLDVQRFRKGTQPFLAFGMNALTAYIVAALIGRVTSITGFKGWVYENILTSILDPYNASFAYSILNTLFIFIGIWWMYKKDIVIKV